MGLFKILIVIGIKDSLPIRNPICFIIAAEIELGENLTLISVGFLGVRFAVEGVKTTPPSLPHPCLN